MAPAVLIDLNEDQTLDLLLPMFNSTVIAIDGQSLRRLWRTRFAESESYSTPAVAFFNDDHVPDLIVQYQHGPGFPIYYYSQVQVLDGRDGRPLLNSSIKMLIGSQSSPLSISIRSKNDDHLHWFGHDMFLYWDSGCEDSAMPNYSNAESIAFKLRFANVHEASRADYCRLRFGKQMKSRLQAIAHHQAPITLYDSSDAAVKRLEIAFNRNYTKIGREFLRQHPQYDKSNDAASVTTNQLRPETTSAQFVPMLPLANIASSVQKTSFDDSASDNLFAKYKSRFSSAPIPKQPVLPWSIVSGAPSTMNVDMPPVHFERYLDSDFFASAHDDFGPEVESDGVYERSPQDFLQQNEQLKQPPGLNEDSSLFNFNNVNNDLPMMRKRRRRRHVGMHDGDGVQRIISTGTLAPSAELNAIDLIFTTYWIPRSRSVKLVTPKMQQCLDFYMRPEVEQIRFNPNSNLAGYDHDAYVEYVNDLCDQLLHVKSSTGPSRSTFNPFQVPMGSLTIYRKRLRCANPTLTIQSYDRQMWPAYLGLHANGVANT